MVLIGSASNPRNRFKRVCVPLQRCNIVPCCLSRLGLSSEVACCCRMSSCLIYCLLKRLPCLAFCNVIVPLSRSVNLYQGLKGSHGYCLLAVLASALIAGYGLLRNRYAAHCRCFKFALLFRGQCPISGMNSTVATTLLSRRLIKCHRPSGYEAEAHGHAHSADSPSHCVLKKRRAR